MFIYFKIKLYAFRLAYIPKNKIREIMIKQCELSGDEIIGFPYKCKYCNIVYCLKQRLPENHVCTLSGSKRLVPQKLEVGGTYYNDNDVLKRSYKSKKVRKKKKHRKKKNC